MRRFFAQYWFLFALLILLALGTFQHQGLKPLADRAWIRNANMAAVLFLMSLPLEFRALWDTIRRPGPSILATFVSYVVAPFVAWLTHRLLGPEYGPGFLVAAVTPCTMASAAVWTRRAGGNDAVALVVTAMTNIVCFIVTPTLLIWTAGEAAANAKIDASALMQELMWLVVIPLVMGQVVRLIPQVGSFTTRHKMSLGLLAQGGILLMVLLAAIKTGDRLARQTDGNSPLEFATMIAAVVGLHLLLFFLGMRLARLLNMSREDELAVGFCGSQKTLVVGLKVADDCGFSILPMISYHILQLFIDTILVEQLRDESPPKK